MLRPIIPAAPMGSRSRVSAAAAWPLRGVDGLTFAERKRAAAAKQESSSC